MKGLEPRVFIQQAAKATKSSDKIVSSLVYPIEDLRGDLATDEYDYLKELDLRNVVMRGAEVSPDGRNEKTWATMEIGDIALIAWRGHIEAVGEIVMRKRSSNPKHGKFQLLYFLRDVDRLHVPYAQMNSILGYKKNNSFQRFTGLTEENSNLVLDLLRRIAPALPLLSQRTLAHHALEGEMDSRAEINRRREQGVLRKLFFGDRDDGLCALCGRVFPIGFLVAAHIKKRAACSDDEKRDASGNVIPACRFGCDELFERGYILGIEGVFKRSEAKPVTQAVRSYIDLVEGRRIQDWERRAKYFAWHAENHCLQPSTGFVGQVL